MASRWRLVMPTSPLALHRLYGPGLVFWTNAFGAWADFDGNKNAASADRNLGGFVSGNGCARHSLLAARRCYWGIVLRHLGRCTPARSPQTRSTTWSKAASPGRSETRYLTPSFFCRLDD